MIYIAEGLEIHTNLESLTLCNFIIYESLAENEIQDQGFQTLLKAIEKGKGKDIKLFRLELGNK